MEQEVTSSLFCFTDTTFISSSFVCLSDESRQRGCQRFLSRLFFVLIQTRTRARRLLRLQKLLIYAAIDNRFFSVYTTFGHPALISALGYLSAISILQLYYIYFSWKPFTLFCATFTLLFSVISTSSLNGTAHRSTTGIYRFLWKTGPPK